MNRLAVAHFTGRQQIRIAAAADGPRLETEHRAQADAADPARRRAIAIAQLMLPPCWAARLPPSFRNCTNALPCSMTAHAPAGISTPYIGDASGSHAVPEESRGANRSGLAAIVAGVLLFGRRLRRRRLWRRSGWVLMWLCGLTRCRRTDESGPKKTKRDPQTHQSATRRSRRALPITETELKVIAALAIIGLSSTPSHG